LPLRVIPVLDLKAGRALHAVAGARDHYGPVTSVLHPASDPIGLARAFREVLGLDVLYLADLDAIRGVAPVVGLYRSLRDLGLTLWVDAGIRDAGSLPPLRDAGIDTLVVGLETLRGPNALGRIARRWPAERIVLSLDLRSGMPLIAEGADWGEGDAETIVGSAVARGVRRILLLDLARVGTGAGTGTLPLLARLAAAHPGTRFAVGGGVAGPDDLETIARAGASEVLVGSALHDGRIGAAELGAFRLP
jgi:phosphoribosylformimino-5-aminoimidazole carboxamide ribotide isomerase